jgi:hypothetical protein
MIAIYKYSEIQDTLREHFEERYKRQDVNITGVLVARPETSATRAEIIPHLNYWHYRSDYYTEFFCVGYIPLRPGDDPEARPVARVGGRQWFFSPQAFSEVLDEIERQTKWRYDSKAYLIITNSRYDRATKEARLDFSGAMVIDIGDAVKNEAIASASELADALFEFAKGINEDTEDPVWEFSDKQGFRVLRRSLREYLIQRLPKYLRQPTRQAIHFVARDLEAKPA